MQGKIFREKEIKIKVREELEIVQFYLFLQKERYQDKLTYEINIEDEQIKENLIPRLLIEPLVENAVSHGLEKAFKLSYNSSFPAIFAFKLSIARILN